MLLRLDSRRTLSSIANATGCSIFLVENHFRSIRRNHRFTIRPISEDPLTRQLTLEQVRGETCGICRICGKPDTEALSET